jgi:hypothetical protein
VSVQAPLIASEKLTPIRAEDGLPEEVKLELRRGNLVRAAHVAMENGAPREKVRELQSNAIRQFIEQLHNFEGAKELVSSYGLNDDEVRMILQKIMQNPRSHTESTTWFNRKNGKMVASTLAQRIQTDQTFRASHQGKFDPSSWGEKNI